MKTTIVALCVALAACGAKTRFHSAWKEPSASGLDFRGQPVAAVVVTPNAEAARERLASGEELSLVIIDLFLPEMEGPNLLRTIRRSLRTQALPVIVVTGSSNPRHELELLDAGADDYLLKPIVTDRIEARIRAVMRRSGVRLGGVAAAVSEQSRPDAEAASAR